MLFLREVIEEMRYQFSFEFTGKNTNIILLDKDGIIVEALNILTKIVHLDVVVQI